MTRKAIFLSTAELLQRAYARKRRAYCEEIGWPYPKRRRKRPPIPALYEDDAEEG